MSDVRPRPRPPRPDLVRRPTGPFGWLDASLLHEGWLANLGAEPTSVLMLLALAADRHGASFHSRGRMVQALSLGEAEIDRALARLLELDLVTQRPWSPGHPDGVWQLLPVPPRPGVRRDPGPTSVGAALAALGLTH